MYILPEPGAECFGLHMISAGTLQICEDAILFCELISSPAVVQRLVLPLSYPPSIG